MDRELRENMHTYYDERACEYDEIYTGKGPASMSDPVVYKEETNRLKQIVTDICAGDILDIPSGTAFWLPSYAQQCRTALLVDQSGKMLEASRQRAQQNGIEDRCQFLQLDISDFVWTPNQFDSVLVGFFISHLPEEEEAVFLSRVRDALKPRGKLLMLDSTWNQERAVTRKKEGEQGRQLNDGTKFKIYKKYFERTDIKEIGEKYNFDIDIHYFGQTFCAVSGKL